MDKFTTLTGIAAPMPLVNIDTDMIIPKQFLKTIKRTGLGTALFSEMRYKEDGSENPDFVLNQPAYRKSEILVAGIAGLVAGAMTFVGLVMLIYRRRTVRPVFKATTPMDKVMYLFLAGVILLGIMAATLIPALLPYIQWFL